MRWSQDSAAQREWGSQDLGTFESGGEGKISFPLLSERHEGLGREVGEGLGNCEVPPAGPAHTKMSTSLKSQ